MPVDFSNEKEVKEYLENLGTEYRFGCFSEKKPEVCHLLGEYLDVIKGDFHKAARIYKSNCDDENFGKSCHVYANYLFKGTGVEKSEDKAYIYYSKACSLGVPSSCFNAGIMSLRPGTKREKDYTKGMEMLDKSCALKNAFACYFLSGMYITGSQDKDVDLKKDMKQAFKYAEKACDLDHIYACINLSVMYKNGDGVDKNEDMSKKILEKAEKLKDQYRTPVSVDFQRNKDNI